MVGCHAHKWFQQLAVAVSGSCVIWLDDGSQTKTVHLNSPSRGVRIGSGVWRVMKNFTPDCVLVVFADALYDEADYIRDYDIFLKTLTSSSK